MITEPLDPAVIMAEHRGMHRCLGGGYAGAPFGDCLPYRLALDLGEVRKQRNQLGAEYDRLAAENAALRAEIEGRRLAAQAVLAEQQHSTQRWIEKAQKAEAENAALAAFREAVQRVRDLAHGWAEFEPAGHYPEAHAEADANHDAAEQIFAALDGAE